MKELTITADPHGPRVWDGHAWLPAGTRFVVLERNEAIGLVRAKARFGEPIPYEDWDDE